VPSRSPLERMLCGFAQDIHERVDGSKLKDTFWLTVVLFLFIRVPRKVLRISVSPRQSRELSGENLTVSFLPMFSSKFTAVVWNDIDAALAALH
jgi:hypothetical protein